MAADEREVTIEILCTDPPDSVWTDGGTLHVGIQKDQLVQDLMPVDRHGLRFSPVLRVRRHADGTPNFLGPFTHGPRAERFIYLNWISVGKGAAVASVGRIKLHLNHITWKSVETAVAAGKPLKVSLGLRKPNGAPVFASVRENVAHWLL